MSVLGNHLAGGSPFLKWEMPGTSYAGTITNVELRQARKYQSTELDVWDDGTPKMQCLLTLATDYRDAAYDDDDGTRMLSINLWSGQKKALIAACKAAGVPEPQVGQTITVTHVSGLGSASSPREFSYVLGAAPTGVATALAEPAAAPVAAPAPAPAAPAPTSPVDIAKSILQAGGSAADAAAASGLPETTVAALANTLPAA